MFGRKCSSPGYGFVSGILFIFFFAALSGSLHCGKTLGPEKSFEYGKVLQEYGWETRTFEEGKKKAPLIQGGGLRQAHTIEKVENPSSRLLNSCQFPREIIIVYQQNSKKNPVFLYIFQGLVQIEAIPFPIASIWLDCFEVETLRNIQTAKHCLVWVSFVFAQNGKHWLCSTCLAMLHTAQFREGSYSFVVKHWVKSSKRVENAGFFAHFGTKVHNSCQFPREIIIVYQQNSKNPVFLHIFQGLVQIEAILSFGPWKTNCFYLNGTWGVCNVHFK